MRAAWLAALPLLLTAAAAQALGGAQTMVLGRMVQARPDAPAVAATGSPRARFVLHCSGCHGADGRGAPQRYVPDLRRVGDFLRVVGGREFVISVPGVMGSGLSDPQVAELTNWLLATLARDSVPAGHQPFSTEEVTRARAAPLVDVAARRRQLQQRARGQGLAID
jgi:mono/diheme cytochrome c family protein